MMSHAEAAIWHAVHRSTPLASAMRIFNHPASLKNHVGCCAHAGC